MTASTPGEASVNSRDALQLFTMGDDSGLLVVTAALPGLPLVGSDGLALGTSRQRKKNEAPKSRRVPMQS